jgi:predicted dehydrogenase
MINIGVIGLNNMGTERIRALTRIPGARTARICTRNPELLAATAAEFGIGHASTEWRDVADDPEIDAVCVCTPNSLHFEMARRAIANGKHVLIEYPLAVTLADIDALLSLADDAGVILHEGLTTRYEPQHLKAKELLPTLGEPVELHGAMSWPTMWKWSTDERLMGSFFALANFHLVDQWMDLYGRPEWISASLWNRKQQNALSMISGSMFFGYRSGLSAYVSYSMGVPNQKTFMHFRLVHAEGMIEFRDDEFYLTRRGGAVESIPLQGSLDESFLSDTEQFIQEIEVGHPHLPPEQTALAAKLCLLAQMSADEHRTVPC